MNPRRLLCYLFGHKPDEPGILNLSMCRRCHAAIWMGAE